VLYELEDYNAVIAGDSMKRASLMILLIILMMITFNMPLIVISTPENQIEVKVGEFWRTDLSYPVLATFIEDFNGDDISDILLFTLRKIYLLDYLSNVTLSMEFDENIWAYYLGNIDNDTISEIILSTETGYLYLLKITSSKMKTLWKTKIGFGSPAYDYEILDIDGDGVVEIAAAARNYRVYMYLNNGSQIVEQPVTTEYVHLASVDVQHDGDQELIIATEDSNIYYLDGGNMYLWFTRPGISFYDIIADDLDSDGTKEVYSIASDGALRAHRFTGGVLWSENLGYIPYHLFSKDVDNDGFKEIVVYGERSFSVIRYDGTLMWNISLNIDASIVSVTTLNMDFDDALEFIVLTSNNMLYLFDGNTLISSYSIVGLGKATSMAVGNFDANYDDVLSEIVIGTLAGNVLVLGFDVDGDGLLSIEENIMYHTDPLKKDSDGDEINDYDEIIQNTDPLNPDTDRDGIIDGFDTFNGLNDYYIYSLILVLLIGIPSVGILRIRRRQEV